MHEISLKSSYPGQFSGSSNSCRYHWIFKLVVAEKSEVGGTKLCVAFLIFLVWEALCFKVKKSIIFIEQKYER